MEEAMPRRKRKETIDMPGESFFDLATTTRAAQLLDAIYGQGAARACIKCALAANFDNRPKDRTYWHRVFLRLKNGNLPALRSGETVH